MQVLGIAQLRCKGTTNKGLVQAILVKKLLMLWLYVINGKALVQAVNAVYDCNFFYNHQYFSKLK